MAQERSGRERERGPWGGRSPWRPQERRPYEEWLQSINERHHREAPMWEKKETRPQEEKLKKLSAVKEQAHAYLERLRNYREDQIPEPIKPKTAFFLAARGGMIPATPLKIYQLLREAGVPRLDMIHIRPRGGRMDFNIRDQEIAQEVYKTIKKKDVLKKISAGLGGLALRVEWVWAIQKMKVYLSGVPTHFAEETLQNILFGDVLRLPRKDLVSWKRLCNEFGTERDVVILKYTSTPLMFHMFDLMGNHTLPIPGARIFWHWVLPPTPYVPWCKTCNLVHLEPKCPELEDETDIFEAQTHLELPEMGKQAFKSNWVWDFQPPGKEEVNILEQGEWPKLGDSKKRGREERDTPAEKKKEQHFHKEDMSETEILVDEDQEDVLMEDTTEGNKDPKENTQSTGKRKISFPPFKKRAQTGLEGEDTMIHEPQETNPPKATLGDWMNQATIKSRGRGRPRKEDQRKDSL